LTSDTLTDHEKDPQAEVSFVRVMGPETMSTSSDSQSAQYADPVGPEPGVHDRWLIREGREQDKEGVKVQDVTDDKDDHIEPDNVKLSVRDECVTGQGGTD
jgi:hypothetical protein